MRKHILLLIVLTFVVSDIYANPIDPSRAMSVAEQFMPSQPAPKKSVVGTSARQTSEIVYTHYMPKSGKPAIYVVNISGGFALISADDVAHPVLGYNYSKPWPMDIDSLAPSVKGFLDDLAAQMEAASGQVTQDPETAAEWQQPRRSPNRALRRAKNDNLPDSVGPLLTTTWDQGQYYNAMCPVDGQSQYDGHVPTGCVATAMAQIIKYWGDKQEIKTRGIHSYDSNYGNLRVNYDSTSYDFAHMPNQLTAQSTQQEIDAVAKLMYECGVAVNMGYGPNESSSYDLDARAALINFFFMNPDAGFAERAYYLDDKWDNILRENIAAGKPILYSGNGDMGGHSFICHGYKQNGYFYFNFGWSGAGDGWYLSTAVHSGLYQFNSSQMIVLDLVPENTGNVILGQMAGSSTFQLTEPMEVCHLKGHNSYLSSDYSNPCSCQIAFVSADHSGQLVTDILNFDNQNLSIYDGLGTADLLRSMQGGSTNDLSPIVTSAGAVTLLYTGNTNNTGFRVMLSLDSGCRMVSNITTTIDTTTVHLTWTENGTATQWEIEYGVTGFTLGEGIQQTISTNAIDLTNLQKFTEYDIYIRSFCGEDQYGLWNKVTIQVKAPYWQDIVTTQPGGFKVSEETDNYGRHIIAISSAEGMAWWAKQVREGNVDYRTTVSLVADIDLGEYLWTPIYEYYGTFNGNGHVISHMTIVEEGENSLNSGWGFFRVYRGYNENLHTTISNLVFRNPRIEINDKNSSTGDITYIAGTGIISGRLFCANVINCEVQNGEISQLYANSTYGTGMLSGWVDGSCEITNSHAGGILYSVPNSVGGLVGYIWGEKSSLYNCYSSVRISSPLGQAGSLIGRMTGADIKNCYGVNDYPLFFDNEDRRGQVIDTSRYNRETKLLADSIFFEKIGHVDLLCVLNNRVEAENSSEWRIWREDATGVNNGFPILGDRYTITCPNVDNLKVVNIEKGSGYAMKVTWDETEIPSPSYEVKYWEADSSDLTAATSKAFSNYIEIEDLRFGRIYNVSVRRFCDETHHSGWGKSIQIMYDKPYWTDIVTTQPEGYVEDADGNITIHTAEGLAWLSCLINGLQGGYMSYYEKTISLASDIDLSKYKWMPMGLSSEHSFLGSFNGNNHTISNIYINEKHDYVGLFGLVSQPLDIQETKFKNLTIKNCSINGLNNVGGIAGILFTNSIAPITLFDNCHVQNASINGKHYVGALVGRISNYADISIKNISASGTITGIQDIGGICGNGGNGNSITIANGYTLCNIISESGNSGGLFGWSQDCQIQNFYTAGTVNNSKTGASGSILGFICDNVFGNYLYSKTIAETIPPIGDITIGCTFSLENSTHFSESGILDAAIDIEELPYTNLLSVLNAWVGANNSEGNYRSWAPDTVNVNGGFPVFKAIPSLKYAITFQNTDGVVLQRDTLKEGTLPIYAGVSPTRQSTAQYTYTFTGWAPEVVVVTGDATYTAQYDSVANKYTVTFRNYDGTELQSGIVEYGLLPAFNGATPIKPETADSTYTFTGWTPDVVAVTGEATYTATFTATYKPKYYTITFQDWDGSVLAAQLWEEGTVSSCAAPTRPATAQYVYFFTGWSPEVVVVTGDATYTAQYDSVANKYTVTFRNYDGTELQSGQVEYGLLPAFNGATPIKPETADSTYTFAGWSPEVVAVTSDATYTATFAATYKPKYYTIIFVNWDNEELQRDILEEGTLPEYTGDTPTKTEDDENWYNFDSWAPEIVPATADATYTAVYTTVPKSGTTDINDVVNDSVVLQKVIIDDKIYILRRDRVYTITGQEMR